MQSLSYEFLSVKFIEAIFAELKLYYYIWQSEQIYYHC